MPLKLPQSALIFNNYIDYEGDKIKVTTSPNEEQDLNVLLLAADAYYSISGDPTENSKKAFEDTFNFIYLKSYSFLPSKKGELKPTEKAFPPLVFIDGPGPGQSIPFDLYNQDFFLITVDQRQEGLDLAAQMQATVDVFTSDLNSLSGKILLAFQGLPDNEYSKEGVLTVSSKTIAALDHIFLEADGTLAIPVVKAINEKEAFEKKIRQAGAKGGGGGGQFGPPPGMGQEGKDAGFSFVNGMKAAEGLKGFAGGPTGAGAGQPVPGEQAENSYSGDS